ncbi:MAG: hypothetical protein AAGK21_11785 [Bacteroidota bacterium]
MRWTALLLMLVGCDARVRYRLEVVNRTPVEAVVTVGFARGDSVVTLAPDATAIVVEVDALNRGVQPYFREGDTIWWLRFLTAVDASGRSLGDSLRLVDRWRFSRSDTVGVYRLVLE